jgi:hypothetical protein
MESCYQKKVCNCIKNCTCDVGYECCSENIPDGKSPIFGLCVARGTCDKKRGTCSGKKQSIEHFENNSQYENNMNILTYFPFILFGCLIFIILYLKIKTQK